MTASPEISVIVPVYNAGHRLIPSIDSLLNQTLKDIEIIIVNDASTDDTAEVVDRIARQFGNVIPIHFTENKGVHLARTAGVASARAPWIGFLDADDYARPRMFESLCRAGDREDVDIVICGSYRVNAQRKIIRKRSFFKKSGKISGSTLEKLCNLEFGDGALWNKLYRRELISYVFSKEHPWRQNINEDMIVNVGAFREARSVYLMKEVLHESVVNSSSVTAKMPVEKAYVETFRAYAAALHVHDNFSMKERFLLTVLYARQLENMRCTTKERQTITECYASELHEATETILSVYPQGLPLLSCRSADISFMPGRKLFSAFIRKLVSSTQRAVGDFVGRLI